MLHRVLLAPSASMSSLIYEALPQFTQQMINAGYGASLRPGGAGRVGGGARHATVNKICFPRNHGIGCRLVDIGHVRGYGGAHLACHTMLRECKV